MTESAGYLKALLDNLKKVRERSGLSRAQLEERLILGPGWIQRFEQGHTVPSIDMLLALLHETGAGLNDLLDGLPAPEAASVERAIFGEQEDNNVIVHFKYANYDAKYVLKDADLDEFEEVIKTLRNGLSRLNYAAQGQGEAVKADSVAKCFLAAASLWPHVSPSDLWWFIVYRAYCDPYNHPASYARGLAPISPDTQAVAV